MRPLQMGLVQFYALAMVLGMLILVAARLMWAIQQWTARLYVLTDMRILRIAGVFNVSIFDCPLRKRKAIVYGRTVDLASGALWTLAQLAYAIGDEELVNRVLKQPLASNVGRWYSLSCL